MIVVESYMFGGHPPAVDAALFVTVGDVAKPAPLTADSDMGSSRKDGG